MLTSFRDESFPAAYCTITSVPPAMGSHLPGSLARRDTTACKLPSATRSYSAGLDFMTSPAGARLSPPLRRSAYIRCSGRDFRPELHGCLPAKVQVFCLKDRRPPESFPGCRCRTGLRRIRETLVAV